MTAKKIATKKTIKMTENKNPKNPKIKIPKLKINTPTQAKSTDRSRRLGTAQMTS